MFILNNWKMEQSLTENRKTEDAAILWRNIDLNLNILIQRCLLRDPNVAVEEAFAYMSPNNQRKYT